MYSASLSHKTVLILVFLLSLLFIYLFQVCAAFFWHLLTVKSSEACLHICIGESSREAWMATLFSLVEEQYPKEPSTPSFQKLFSVLKLTKPRLLQEAVFQHCADIHLGLTLYFLYVGKLRNHMKINIFLVAMKSPHELVV